MKYFNWGIKCSPFWSRHNSNAVCSKCLQIPHLQLQKSHLIEHSVGNPAIFSREFATILTTNWWKHYKVLFGGVGKKLILAGHGFQLDRICEWLCRKIFGKRQHWYLSDFDVRTAKEPLRIIRHSLFFHKENTQYLSYGRYTRMSQKCRIRSHRRYYFF